jgi:hypothetical protein
MALTYPQRGFAGAAVAGTLASPGLTSTDGAGVTFTSSTTLTGWTEIPRGSWSGDNICVTFGYGTASEEKILCTFNASTNTFTIVTRGYDGTSAVAHTTGSLFVNAFTATEAAELNAVTQSMKNLLLTNGLSALPADISTSAAALGTSTNPAAADHTHKLSNSTLNNWLSGSASGQMNAAVTVYTSSIGAGVLPSGVTIPLAQVTNPPAADSADSSANYATTNTGTANALSASVNPAGSHKQYVWRVNLTQQANASAATVDITAIIRYRVVGAATWTSGSGANIGTCVATNDYRTLSGGGVVTLGTADNYEFQIGFQTGASGQTVSLNRIRLVVEGLN